jgi:hypothetical protein
MNWTCVVYGGPMFLILIAWVVDARKWFKGPKVNVQHLMLGRDGNLIEGEGKDGDDDSSENLGVDNKIVSEGHKPTELPETIY